jgi:hypothetical protein
MPATQRTSALYQQPQHHQVQDTGQLLLLMLHQVLPNKRTHFRAWGHRVPSAAANGGDVEARGQHLATAAPLEVQQQRQSRQQLGNTAMVVLS